MSRLKKQGNGNGLYHDKHKDKEYDYEKTLNWRDDGDELSDPSMNDYLKGYNMNPYEFKQWAKKKENITKMGAIEVDTFEFNPEYLADKILRLWNGADGPLQNFFEAFTLRYDNKMKKELAAIIESKGYEVFPVLVDDKPRHAKNEKVLKKVMSSKNVDHKLHYMKLAFKESKLVKRFVKEVESLKREGHKITLAESMGLLEYYTQVYPEDYATSLVNCLLNYTRNSEKNTDLKKFKDIQLSDESLDAMENMMSGNADPFYVKDFGSGDMAYDSVSDMRSDGTMPGNYEIRISKKKH